ncbi:TonB-dependent siderophore receptor [Pacificibacter marinus]|uniref:Ferrichrome-iron receptor n=1 Tax=Pacificibacter marinus TaxID=658057 RepID=A0A1Y5S799_9RHOB|nr:TonB-dependent siderophore receptor [Pacificibacter marinus]SEK79514.1 iron complex outermembrane recepter protein [Pacificibacter marinus]SLN33115.1 Ferrichrome-iron receptor precursor [Pacificibacter marinus]
MSLLHINSTRPQRGLAALMSGCAVICLCAPSALLAQDNDRNIELAPIVVEGAEADNDSSSFVAVQVTNGGKLQADILNTAATVSVVTSKEIETRRAVNTEQVLQYTSGVATDFYGSDDRFDNFLVRGFDAYTYRDGLSLGAAFGGVREEPFAFERIEILKGANSADYGVSDPGGAVNYVTKVPTDERLRKVYLTYGSNNHKEVGFDLSDHFDDAGTLSWRLTGKVQDADAETNHSQNNEVFLMGGLTWRPSDATSLTVVYDHLDRDAVPGSGGYPNGIDFDRSTFFGEPDFNYRGTERDTVTVKFDHDFGSGLSIASTARYSDSESDFGYAYVAGIASLPNTLASRYYFANDSSASEVAVDAHLLYETQFGMFDSRTLVGVAYSDSSAENTNYWALADNIDWTNPTYSGGIDLATLTPYLSNATETTSKAIYLQEDVTVNDRFIANVGLRHDWIDVTQVNKLTSTSNSGSFNETTGRVGLTYKVRNDLSVYGSYAQSVTPAGIGVDPERGEQYELGAKYRPDGMRALFTASVFDLSKTNMTVTNPVTLVEETIGKARVRGIDFEAKAEMTEALSLTAAYSYLESEIIENGTGGNEGNELKFVPNTMASLWLDYTLAGQGSRGDATFGLGARYTGEYWLTDGNTSKSDDAVILDLAVSYAVSDATEIALNVTNLLDEKHVAYGGFGADFYNPGRNISATLRHSW